MALSTDEVGLLGRHKADRDVRHLSDTLMSRYFEGEQLISQLGMAVPPDYSRFLLIVNWPGMFVESIEARQDVRTLILPDQNEASTQLDEIWRANNLDSDLSLFLQDRYVYGRAFLSVGSNEDDPGNPLIHVESPREISAFVDTRKRVITSAAKFYVEILDGAPWSQNIPTNAALYLPNETVWATFQDGGWVEVDRDQHNLGRVALTMSLCRRQSGAWRGRPLIQRVNNITDACARALTNLQFASEAHGVPTRYALGVKRDDFVDKDGQPLPQWAAYFNSLWANGDKDVKVGQFVAASLANFETQINLYGRLAASATYLPAKYFGITTTNPPSADAIRAEEAQLVKFVERQNTQVTSVIGWTSAIAMRLVTGDWIDGSKVGVEWQDPSTPTIAQREDALMKRRSVGVLSRQGYWDELGWSEQRKSKEQAYLDEEAATDPLVTATRQLATPGAVPSAAPSSN